MRNISTLLNKLFEYLQVFLVSGFIFLTDLSFAQFLQGEVIYAQTNHWPKIAAGLSYLNLEERDRISLIWGKNEGYTERMRLVFNDSVSLYTYILNDKSEDSNWSYKKSAYEIYRNYNTQTTFDRQELLGKTYIIQDKIPIKKWKILADIKDVAGYVCMKAETYDSIKNQKITAWFTDKILISAGPAEFGGLPGLILEIEINDKASLIVAETIKLEEIGGIYKPKAKAKQIDFKAYQQIVKTYISDCIERRRNPFWDLRY